MQQSRRLHIVPKNTDLPDSDDFPSHTYSPAEPVPFPVNRRVNASVETEAQRRKRSSGKRLLFLSGSTALSYLFALAVFHLQELASLTTLVAATGLVAAGLVAFYFLLNGYGPYRLDPKKLTVPMSIFGLAIMMWVMYRAPATHMMYPPFVFAALAFGSHWLSRKTTVLLSTAALAGYGFVVWLYYNNFQNPALLKLQLLHMMVMALALPGFVLLASRLRLLNSALHKASMKIENIQENARRDHLTGCFNRRYTIAVLEQQKRIADDTGQPLCLAVLDLDHFKRINDELGHLAGDKVLCLFAEAAQVSIRQTDVLGRYGGEEFLLVLPHTPLLTALNIAERIRERTEHHAWNQEMAQHMTVSIGLTQYIPGESVLELFSRTDTAMYMAKTGGRNQVVVEEPRPE